MSQNNKNKYGQFFTKNKEILSILVDLISKDKDKSKILEPSCGEGYILSELENQQYKNILGLEIDATLTKLSKELPISYQSYFTYKEKVDVIIGNPPFVQYKKIEDDTRKEIEVFKEYSNLSNLYYFFIHYSIDILKDNGELIFIVPKEWVFSTSAKPLREHIANNGILSHFIDLGEQKIFKDASIPALCIFKFIKRKQKDNYYKIKYANHKLKQDLIYEDKQLYVDSEANILIGDKEIIDKIKKCSIQVKDLFIVKVGLGTGANNIFNITDNVDFLNEKDNIIDLLTAQGLQRYIYIPNKYNKENINSKVLSYLDKNKKELKNKQDYYKYTAYRNIDIMEEYENINKIFVSQKTRQQKPFFIEYTTYHNNALLGLFPKNKKENLDKYLEYFNSDYFLEIMKIFNLYSNNKITIQQTLLEKLPILIKNKQKGL